MFGFGSYIGSLFFGLSSKTRIYLMAAGLVIAVVIFIYYRGRNSAIDEMRREHIEEMIEDYRMAKGVDNEVANLDSKSLDNRLLKWIRE